MRDDAFYLQHILQCIERIEKYTVAGRDAFLADTKTQDAVVHNLQILAESTLRLTDTLKSAHPEIPWREIAGFRNVAVHDYLGVDLPIVWDIVERDIPDLKKKVHPLLSR